MAVRYWGSFKPDDTGGNVHIYRHSIDNLWHSQSKRHRGRRQHHRRNVEQNIVGDEFSAFCRTEAAPPLFTFLSWNKLSIDPQIVFLSICICSSVDGKSIQVFYSRNATSSWLYRWHCPIVCLKEPQHVFLNTTGKLVLPVPFLVPLISTLKVVVYLQH